MKEYPLTIKAEHLKIINECLMKGAYCDVYPVIQNINEQIIKLREAVTKEIEIPPHSD